MTPKCLTTSLTALAVGLGASAAAQAAQVKKVGGLLTEDLLKEAVVHRLKKEDMESLAGRGYRPGTIRVVPGGLRLTLDPVK